MTITNPAELPGAFLFFTIKLADNSSFAAVAYDENITKDTKLADLQKKYLGGLGAHLPYMEKFDSLPTDGTHVWQGKTQISYGGVFGGPDPAPPTPPNRISVSGPWPYAEIDGHPIQKGVYISYWNFPNNANAKGMHTSSTSKHFAKGSEVPYMPLFPGNRTNLVKKASALVKKVVTEVNLDWYARHGTDLEWNKEEI